MCGIAAIVDRKGRHEEALGAMLDSIRHRGPDAHGTIILKECALGHARLSVIDLATGAQPMSYADGRYWITFNGEIYNYRELRSELELMGHQFKSTSDTEVILAAYFQWGAPCVDRMRGMFAFSLWDQQTRSLFAARDIFGEKPLYYAVSRGGALVVASELKAIFASGLIEKRIDLSAVDAYLALGYIPPDRTVFRNVHTLPPGHYLTWQKEAFEVTRYWRPLLQPRQLSLDDAKDRLDHLLRQAVKRQMVADVPIGAFLSGGLDSSTVVALMQQNGERRVKTFSVGFGHYINELPCAKAVAEKYGTEHHAIDLGTPDVARMLKRMAQVYDEPFADTSNIPTYLISEFARKQVKVVLSGDGGDELFGGYSWYPALVKSGEVPKSAVLWVFLRSLSKLLRHRWRSLALTSSGFGLAARWPDMWTRQVMQHVHFGNGQRKTLWGDRSGEVAAYFPGEYHKPSQPGNIANDGFYFDLTSYLPGDILVKVDRAAMAHGLEIRAPFLDRDLAEFAFTLPVSLKVEDNNTKILLQKTCLRYWPEQLRNRKKQGFGSPIGQWLKMPDVQELSEEVFSRGSPLRNLLPGISETDRRGGDYNTWILLTLGLWLRTNKDMQW
ncbi:MAG: asparagine synthase (glutamine-hydrolyzing) [Nibricoccus sp.]